MKKTISQLLAILLGLFLISATCSPSATTVYSISASPLASFGSVTTPYTQPAAKMITITNTGMDAITLDPLPSVPNYTLSTLSTNILATNGATATFTIRPNAGLSAGTYNPTFVVKGSNGVSVTISPTFTVTSSAFTYSITATPATPSFGTRAVGYSLPSPVTVYINNTGTGAVTLNPLPAVANYVLVGPTSTTIPAGSSVTFTIRPNTGLVAGAYNPTFSVTGTHGESATINPSFVVQEFEGSGTLGVPYIIDSEAKLARMRDLVNLDIGGYQSAYYKQTASLNMSSVSDWVPIGTQSNPFKGVYDGNNNSISSIKINGTGLAGGLFGHVDAIGGAIRNVRLSDVYISVSSSYTNAGGVVGVLTAGTVENCRVLYGSITGVENVGGIVGYAFSDAIVQNCFVSLESVSYVTATHTAGNAGGIIGVGFESTVQNCYATVNVSGASAGGVAGVNTGFIEYCYSTGTIFCTGTSGVGGGVAGNNIGMIQCCVALNNSISGGGSALVGRVIGSNWGTLQYNYGRQTMTLLPSHTPDSNHSSKDGANLDLSNAKTEAFYRTASYWGGNVWDFTSIWIMGPTDLPTLRNLGTQTPAIVP